MALVPVDCPCPLERKVLIQAMETIVSALKQDVKVCSGSASALTPRRSTAVMELPLADACPPPRTAEVKECKSSELRAGVFYSECGCLKRDGLQRACRRFGCSDRCGFVRPAKRELVSLGTPVAGYALEPSCCPGRKQADRIKFLEEKAMLRLRPPPLPPLEDRPPPPTPPYNSTGLFPHKCAPRSRCPPRRPPLKIPCGGGAGCKHWEVPKPCKLPVCRADCFENPPGWPTMAR